MSLTSMPGLVKTMGINFPTGSNDFYRTLSPTAINSGNTTGNTGSTPYPQVRSLTGSVSNVSTPQTGFMSNLVGAFPKLSSTPVNQKIAAPFSGGTQSDANSTGGYSPPLGSNTSGGGATYSDANSPKIGAVGYAPPDLAQGDADFMTKQLTGDQQLQADLANIAARQGNYQDAMTSAGQAAEIAAGFGFNAADAAKLGFQTQGPLYSALTDPNVLANAQANPYSANAQINYATQHALNAQDAQMVAHGLARSGDYQDSNGTYTGGYQHEATQYQQGLAQYNAMQDFLSKLTSGYNTYTGQLSDLDTQTASARNNALNRILAMINAGALTLPSKGTPPPTQPPYPAGGAPPPQTSQAAAPSFTNPNPAITSVAGSGAGAAGDTASNIMDFLGGTTNPRQVAAQNGAQGAGAVGNDILSMLGGNPVNDGEYDRWVANGGDNPISIPDTGSALGDAQASWMDNTPNPNQVYKQFNLSPGIGNWRT